MANEQIDRNFRELQMKLAESGDLAGLEMEPDEATGKFVGGMAVRLRHGSKQIAMALIGTGRVILAGDEVAEKLAARIGLGFIHARDLAKRVVAGIPPDDLAKLIAEQLPSEHARPGSFSVSPTTPRSAPGSSSSPDATSLEQSDSGRLDTLEKHPPPRERGVLVDNPKDVGPEVIDYLFRSLQIDPKWSIREARKFTWWGHRLAQRVWADSVRMDQAYGIVRVHAETDLLKEVTENQRAVERVSAFNAFGASMSAYVFQPQNQRVKMHCSALFHLENAQWLGALFSAALAIQAADAHIKLDGAAGLLRASPDESQHPVSGARKEADDMLNVIETLFAPQGRGPSSFGKDDFASALAMKPSPWVLANGDDSGVTAEFPFPGCMPPTALLKVSAEERHPQLGSGAFFMLKLPVNLRGVNGEELANKLNCAEAAEWTHCHYFGGWCKDPDDNLAFVSFIPSTLRRSGLLESLLSSMANRAKWSNEFFASEKGIPHKFQGRDRGSYQRQAQQHPNLFTRIADFLLNRKPE